MPNLEGQRAYLMLDQPSAFLSHVLPEIQGRTPRLQDLGDPTHTHEVLLHLQEDRWERETEVPAKDSKFTVILPIYNEAKALPSTLSALMLSDIPQSVEAQFLFIVNATTDASATIVKQHLATISDVEEIPIDSKTDPDVKKTAYRAKKGNVTFTLIETPTRTKANALNIGNEMALQSGHTIAMNIDSDRYVEPGTIPILFAGAYKSFVTENSKQHMLADGTMILTRKKGIIRTVLGDETIIENGKENARLFSLFGAAYSWNTDILNTIGGTKQVLIEDFALALDSYLMGLSPNHTEAKVWGYKASSLFDVINERVRFYRGYMQLRDHWKDVSEALVAIEQNDEINYPIGTRIIRAANQLWERKFSPKQLVTQMAKIVFRELCMGIAQVKHSRYPHKQIWDQLQSTR